MIAGQWAPPVPDPRACGSLAVRTTPATTPTVVDVVQGGFHGQRLAADLTSAGTAPAWVRLEPYDVDRGALGTLARRALANPAVARARTGERLIVVECGDRTQAEILLDRAGLPTGPPLKAVVLRYRAPAKATARATAPSTGPDLDPAVTRRIAHLTGGRVALADAVLRACRQLPAADTAVAAARSRDAVDLTGRLTSALVRDVRPETRALLCLVALLGYSHPSLPSTDPVVDDCGAMPWWTDLADGWRRLEPAWRDGIRAVCGEPAQPRVPLLGRLVSELAADGATDAAIELCLDAGHHGLASDLLAELGTGGFAAERPRAVARWVTRLPRRERRRHRALAVLAREAGHDLVPGAAGRRRAAGAVARPAGPAVTSAADPAREEPVLRARLFGALDVTVAGGHVEDWHGQKPEALLAYLLLHRDRPVAREILVDTFWPDASADAGRNRLHVALHGLRANLRAAADVPVIVFDRGYAIDPTLRVRLDTEEFDRAADAGDRADGHDETAAALGWYRQAAELYRGDLLGDHRTDGWLLLARENYRVRLLDVLGRSAHIAFDLGRYPLTVEVARQLLALDFCREDLHRLLMRTYQRLDRPHLALHQFEVCARQLRQELGIDPAPETYDLRASIRARRAV